MVNFYKTTIKLINLLDTVGSAMMNEQQLVVPDQF